MIKVKIVPLSATGSSAVIAFLDRISEGDTTFFKESVNGLATVRSWADGPGQRFFATLQNEVIGYVAVIPGVGWSSHVGEVRLVVEPSRRRAGVGHDLARHALQAAVTAGLTKIVVEVIAEQTSTIRLFQSLGFTPEALLEDQVLDGEGRLTDLVLLSHRALENWELLETVGLTEPLD